MPFILCCYYAFLCYDPVNSLSTLVFNHQNNIIVMEKRLVKGERNTVEVYGPLGVKIKTL